MAFHPPAVADAKAQKALDAAVDVPAGPANVRVTRSVKRRKIAEGLLGAEVITEAEYGNHETFQARCTADATGGVAGEEEPAWFAPALAAALDANIAGIKADIAGIKSNIEGIKANLVNINARQSNMVAIGQSDPLAPLIDGAGNVDPNFPATLGALNTIMTGPALTASLTFYGQEAEGSDEDRRTQFKKFIGIRL
uniref:Uncharacterized protein n=1 Tax=Entomoneis paludosa TaxID=265537 RepID=A0A7S2YR45_9STRA